MVGGSGATGLVCGTCGEAVKEAADAWVLDCCDTVLCFCCLYTAAAKVSAEERTTAQYQCLSISCFKPLPDYVIKLAIMWQAWRSLRVQDESVGSPKLRVKAWVTRTPETVVVVEGRDSWSLGQMVSTAMRRLNSEVRGPVDVFLRVGNVEGDEYLLEKGNSLHSCRCMEVKEGDAILIDLDGLLPTQTCFSCDATVSKSQVVSFHCGHGLCRTCWESHSRKARGGTVYCPRARCPERVVAGSGTEGRRGPVGVKVLVWREAEHGEIQAQPHSLTQNVVEEAAKKAGITLSNFGVYTHDALNSEVLRLAIPSANHLFAQSLLHSNNNILFVPHTLANKLGHIPN